jgi:hypothetical protein
MPIFWSSLSAMLRHLISTESRKMLSCAFTAAAEAGFTAAALVPSRLQEAAQPVSISKHTTADLTGEKNEEDINDFCEAVSWS